MSYQSSHPRSVVIMAVVIVSVTLLGSGFALLAPAHDRSAGAPHVAHAGKGILDSHVVSEPPPPYRPYNLTSDGQ